MTNDDLYAAIREVLADHAGLPTSPTQLKPESDLYEAGMSLRASVEVMLGLEVEFDLEFPDVLLKRSVFRCMASIREAVLWLEAAKAV